MNCEWAGFIFAGKCPAVVPSTSAQPDHSNHRRQATSLTTQNQTQSTAPATTESLSITELAHTLSTELALGSGPIARTIALLDEGNTIPFIARYRKEITGSLDEVQIQTIADRIA